jgi:hypothetical protein
MQVRNPRGRIHFVWGKGWKKDVKEVKPPSGGAPEISKSFSGQARSQANMKKSSQEKHLDQALLFWPDILEQTALHPV